MLLLSVDSVSKHYGPDPVLDGVRFHLHRGEKVGLVGPNGTGKTTLLRILAGQQQADGGTVETHPAIQVEYLEQQPRFSAARTLWDEASDALSHLKRLVCQAEEVAARLAAVTEPREHRRLADRFEQLQHELHQRDAYHLDRHVEQILQGLGFTDDTFQQPVDQLSGGQQNRLLLAKLLLTRPDVMLLDEPSNHLDVAATEWLENYLAESTSTMILVSHDRYLLDKVTTHAYELYAGTVDVYKGNFSAYWNQKQQRLDVQRRTYEKQQAEIAKMEDFVRRHHHGQKHAQAEDRRKKLARIERVDPPREIDIPQMRFPAASRSGDIVLRAERLSKAFARPLFSELSFEITRGQRWGIFGGNGTGKTTLLRCLLGLEPLDSGQVVLGTGVQAGYFDQRLDAVPGDQPLVEAVRPTGKEFVEQQRRDMLARFGLTGDVAFQTVDSLSGGERSRAGLAKLASMDANLLVLDEPTNHLDLWARAGLERALKQFDGTVLFVSHDRYFLNQVADHLLIVQPNGFRVIEGNYDFYLHLVKQGLAGNNEPPPAKSQATDKTATGDRPKRKRRFPYRKVDEIEQEIAEREADLESLQLKLSSPDIVRSGDLTKQTRQSIEEQQRQLSQLYEHWEEAVELN